MYVVRGGVENTTCLIPLCYQNVISYCNITIIKLTGTHEMKLIRVAYYCVVWANFAQQQNPALESILSVGKGLYTGEYYDWFLHCAPVVVGVAKQGTS